MRLLIPAVAALTLAGCAGPNAPFDIGTQAVPIGLVLGEHQAVVQAPVGPISVAIPPSLAPFLPTVPVSTPSSPTVVTTPVPRVPCPAIDVTAPAVGGGFTIDGPPQPATYQYRAKTTDVVGSSKATYNGNSTWTVTVAPQDPTTGGYDVTTVVSIGKSSTTRVLRVLPTAIGSSAPGGAPLGAPDATDPNAQVIDQYNAAIVGTPLPPLPRTAPNVGRYGPAGVYLVSEGSGSNAFTPTVPMPLVQTPLGRNSFTAIGTDGVTSMTFVSTVKQGFVNACGKKLEAAEVTLTAGKVAGRDITGKVQQVDFTETLDFGLQFGGLPIRDAGQVTGTQTGGSVVVPEKVQRTFDFAVNTTPKPAKA